MKKTRPIQAEPANDRSEELFAIFAEIFGDQVEAEIEKMKALAAIPEAEFQQIQAEARAETEAGEDGWVRFDLDLYNKGRAYRKQAEWEELARSTPVSRSRSTNPQRRTRDDVERIRAAIYLALKTDHPMTIRQLFYRLVSKGAISKTEGEYKQTVIRLTADMRLAGHIPFGWIADNTRWMRKPDTHSSLKNLLEQTARTYRRSIWDEQDAYVEIWLEKDALAGVLIDVTSRWDVPLMVTRGFASLSFLYEAAQTIRDRDKPAFLYYFGDHDPSGVDIPRTVEARLREFAPDAEIQFERVAVNPDQIEAMRLPTRPTKTSDSRSKNFEGESVEVDAIEPSTLKWMAERCIVRHIAQDVHRRLLEVEAAERATLAEIAKGGWTS